MPGTGSYSIQHNSSLTDPAHTQEHPGVLSHQFYQPKKMSVMTVPSETCVSNILVTSLF